MTASRHDLFRFRDGLDPYRPEVLVEGTEIVRFYDETHRMNVVLVPPGRHALSVSRNEMLVTVLASCVAVCARDATSGVAGLLHLLLPDRRAAADGLEAFLSELAASGARRERLEIKLAGGADPVDAAGYPGSRAAAVVEELLAEHALPITAERLRGLLPRRIHYFPASGKVKLLILKRDSDRTVFGREAARRGG